MAAKTLVQLRDVVEADLTDALNETWSTAEVDRAIRRALFRYSEVRPQEAIATLDAVDGREYTLSALSGLLDVQRVWWPYDEDSPELHPAWVEFELWQGRTVLYLKSRRVPTVGCLPLRIFYTKAHTLNGLDSATASTYFVEDEELLVIGATAFAAIQRSRYVVDAVNPTSETPGQWRTWGRDRLKEFEDGLAQLGRRLLRHADSRVWPELEI